MRVLVAGAGGFIGGHLVNRLISEGFEVVASDIKKADEWYQINDKAMNFYYNDLSNFDDCWDLFENKIHHIYNLACNMGGIGFIEHNNSECIFSVLINTNLMRCAIIKKVEKYFFSSTACVYNFDKQQTKNVTALKESDAYPANPEKGYGWEKLFSEQLCSTVMNDGLVETRVARFHSVYGPYGSFYGGREKSVAALCRKVALSQITGENVIDIWGDGGQVRSFMYIDDCIEGILKIMNSDIKYPINLGSSVSYTINELIDNIESIAGVELKREYDLSKPIGVVGRCSDNTLIKKELNWEPSISLQEGLEKTYSWIYERCREGDLVV